MKALIPFAATAAIAAASFSGGAVAGENGHTYNGAFCSAYNGYQSSDFQKQTSGIYNRTTSSRWITCPVVVDQVAKTTGTTRQYMHYTGHGTIRCTMYSKNGNGSNVQSKSANRTNTGWFTMPRITSDSYWGSYNMICLLPAKGRLNTIWLGEQT